MDNAQILIVDDELSLLGACTRTFTQLGHRVVTALTLTEAEEKLNEQEYDVLLIDLKLIGGRGRELLDSVRLNFPATPIVLLLGLSPLSSVETMRRGGYDYLPKPFSPTDLTAVLGRALQQRNALLQARQEQKYEQIIEFGELIGNGPEMRALFRLIRRVAPSGSSIIIVGDEGTGKELVAKAIHRISSRRLEPFVKMESGNVQNVTLSERLFGYIDIFDHFVNGKIHDAGNGTLYLDEITSFDLDCQARLVNAIRQRLFVPINGSEPELLSCRIIFSTGRDLNLAFEQGHLLDELYDDLTLYPIYLPSMHQRMEDIPSLVYYFLARFNLRYGKQIERVDDKLLNRLISRRWPENVRELTSCIENMVILCEDDTLSLIHYKQVMDKDGNEDWQGKPPQTTEELKRVRKRVRRAAVAEVERSFISSALHRCGGNVTHAADEVGMQRRNFQALMRQYGIKAG